MPPLRRLSAAALVALLLAPGAASAQLGFGVTCTPGIPGCTSLRFSFADSGPDVGLNTLNLLLGGSAWTFTPGGSSTVGLYSAVDGVGPFSGFTTIGASGRSAAIDFLDNGFPFTLLSGGTGYLDIQATGTGAPPDASFTATTDGGATITGSSVPEPPTASLLGAGLAALVLGAAHRRREER